MRCREDGRSNLSTALDDLSQRARVLERPDTLVGDDRPAHAVLVINYRQSHGCE